MRKHPRAAAFIGSLILLDAMALPLWLLALAFMPQLYRIFKDFGMDVYESPILPALAREGYLYIFAVVMSSRVVPCLVILNLALIPAQIVGAAAWAVGLALNRLGMPSRLTGGLVRVGFLVGLAVGLWAGYDVVRYCLAIMDLIRKLSG